MDKKKLAMILAVGPKSSKSADDSGDDDMGMEHGMSTDDGDGTDSEDASDEETEMAADVMDAIRSKDDAGLAAALKSFIKSCME